MTCPACGQPLPEAALFCEACGARVEAATDATLGAAPTTGAGPTAGAGPTTGAGPAAGQAPTSHPASDDDSPISMPTAVRPAVVVSAPQVTVCAECGGSVAADGYCDQCGAKASSERDHFREAPAPWLAGVCDRGIVHHRNEDAMALWADPEVPGRSVIVVCDGVSSSQDSDVAALAGARAARDVLRSPLPRGLGVPQSAEAAATKVFVAAAAAANTAVMANTDPSSTSPASCTFVAAIAEGAVLRHAVIGDSRAYWFPDGGAGVQLTTDDSMASMLMAGGMSRAEAESSPQAHAITKWLGKDSPDIVPVTGSLEVSGPGWLLVCSDGLWNYASAPEALVELIAAPVEGGRAEPAQDQSEQDRSEHDQSEQDKPGQNRPEHDTIEPGQPEHDKPGPEASADPAELALRLVEYAKSCGGRDNITVALARVTPPVG